MNVVPPSVLTCHCTVALGSALAAAVNVARLTCRAPSSSVAGGAVICGANWTVNAAALLVVAPSELVNTARY